MIILNVFFRSKAVAFRWVLIAVVFGSVVVPSGTAHAQQAAAGTTVITGGTLIDGTGKAPLRDAMIVIEGNKFKAVGEKGKVSAPPGAKTIDATGKFIIPGLFDSHVHYRDYAPELFLAYGVTSEIDMGNPVDWILAQRDGIAKGKIIGPRIFASGEALSGGPNSQAGLFTPQTALSASVSAGSVEETRRIVRALVAKGVDKISVNISQNPDTFPAIIEEAHKAGIPVSAYTMYPREQVAMGLDIIEHSYSISAGTKKDPNMLEQMRRERGANRYRKHPFYYFAESDGGDEFIRLLVQKGAYVIPSLVFEYKLIHDRIDEFKQDYLRVLNNPDLRYLPYDDYLAQVMNATEGSIPRLGGPGFFGTLDRQSEDFRRYQSGYRELQKFLRKLVEAGGNVLVGTDAPNLLPPGITLHHEMQLLVDAGLTPMQVVVGATLKPATAIRKQNLLGSIEPGKLADLLILRANPLDNIKNTRTIETVIKDGQVVDTTFHPYFANPIPRPISNEAEYNPIPMLRNIVPKAATEGDPDLSLTLHGANYSRESVVLFDGQRVTTTFVNDEELKATIPARLFLRVGTYPVAVWTPRPGGGSSEEARFIVRFKL